MQTIAVTFVNIVIKLLHVLFDISIMPLRPAGICVLCIVPRCLDMQSMDSGRSCMLAVDAGPSVCGQ